MGDAADGVPGVPGIGPKGAAALLREHGSLEGRHVNKVRLMFSAMVNVTHEHGSLEAVLAAAPTTMRASKKRLALIEHAEAHFHIRIIINNYISVH